MKNISCPESHMTNPSKLILPSTCWFYPLGYHANISNSRVSLSDAPMSFENIFLKLALKTPSLDAGLGQVIKSHMQGIKSVTLPGLPPQAKPMVSLDWAIARGSLLVALLYGCNQLTFPRVISSQPKLNVMIINHQVA